MNCPHCQAEMEYVEIKWHCEECGKEYEGERYQIAPDDHEEKIGEEIDNEEEDDEEEEEEEEEPRVEIITD